MHVRYVEAMVNGATMLYLAEGDDLQDGVESRSSRILVLPLVHEPAEPTMGLTAEPHPALGGFRTKALGLAVVPPGRTARRRSASITAGWVKPSSRDRQLESGKRLGYLFEARVARGGSC